MNALSATLGRASGRPGGLESWLVSTRDEAAPITVGDVLTSLRGEPGAYVHVPFCERLCPFCPYNKELHRPAREARYFAALREEAQAICGGARPAVHVALHRWRDADPLP